MDAGCARILLPPDCLFARLDDEASRDSEAVQTSAFCIEEGPVMQCSRGGVPMARGKVSTQTRAILKDVLAPLSFNEDGDSIIAPIDTSLIGEPELCEVSHLRVSLDQRVLVRL